MHGLLIFLQSDPYSVRAWWRRYGKQIKATYGQVPILSRHRCVYEPYLRGQRAPLERLLCSLLWRTAKKDVLHQIEIPAQTYKTHWLSFSPVEEHFYRSKFTEIP